MSYKVLQPLWSSSQKLHTWERWPEKWQTTFSQLNVFLDAKNKWTFSLKVVEGKLYLTWAHFPANLYHASSYLITMINDYYLEQGAGKRDNVGIVNGLKSNPDQTQHWRKWSFWYIHNLCYVNKLSILVKVQDKSRHGLVIAGHLYEAIYILITYLITYFDYIHQEWIQRCYQWGWPGWQDLHWLTRPWPMIKL